MEINTHTLLIKVLESCPNRQDIVEYYQKMTDKIGYQGDAGVDLVFPQDFILYTNTVTKCGMGISCQFISTGSLNGSFDLVSRSSIINTPLSLANGIGIIDSGYRGEIIAAFRCYTDRNHPSTINDFSYHITKGSRLVQIVSPDRNPIKIILTDHLEDTARGTNGFGSTDFIQKLIQPN
jgi:dUTP pyrophosphatase